VLMSIQRLLFPKAHADEVIAFITSHSSNPRVDERSMILRRDLDLNLTKKKRSTNSVVAKLLLKRIHVRYWTNATPSGNSWNTTTRHELIDVDECGIWLGKANRTSGKAFRGCPVREFRTIWSRCQVDVGYGNRYNQRSALSIFTFSKVAGTTLEQYTAFLDDTIALKLPGTLPPVSAPCRTCIHDNLSCSSSPTMF